MQLRLSPERQQAAERILQISVIVAAIATMPLTYAHMQEWDGPLLFAADWLVWSVFFVEFGFFMAISANRRRTIRRQWFNIAIVVVSFPLLPHLLGLTRLFRLFRPLRMLAVGGFRITRPIHLLRLYAMRSAGSKRVMRELKERGYTTEAWEKASEVRDELTPGDDIDSR